MIQIPALALPYLLALALLLGLAFAFWLNFNRPDIAWGIRKWISEPKNQSTVMLIIVIIAVIDFILHTAIWR